MQARTNINLIYLFAFILSACSIVYELLAAQALSALAANTVIWYSLTVGFFLAAMGVGALFAARLGRRWGTWLALFYVELALSITGALVVALIYFGHMLYAYLFVHNFNNVAIVIFFGVAFLVIIIVGILTGFELPLLIKAGNAASSTGRVTNRVLAMDYLGSLLGAVLFPLALIPYLELITIGLLTSVLNFSIAIWIFIRHKERSGLPPWRFAISTLFLASVVIAFFNLAGIHQYFLKKYYYYIESSKSLKTMIWPTRNVNQVQRYSSRYQKIDMVKRSRFFESDLLLGAFSSKFRNEPHYPVNYLLYMNGDYQFRTSVDEIYHEYFAHIPIMKTGRIPARALVLGGGDGLLVKELLKYKQIRNITLVDLDATMIELARTHPILSRVNKGAFNDPRVHVQIGDGYQYVRNTKKTYDAIYIDFPDAKDYNLAKLYSAEFYYFVRQRLSRQGYVVFDAVGLERLTRPDRQGRRKIKPDNDWFILYPTLRKAGFRTIIPYISHIGVDNPRAVEILKRKVWVPSTKDWHKSRFAKHFPDRETHLRVLDKQIKSFIQTHVVRLETGFIMATKHPQTFADSLQSPRVPTYVLNRQRYPLAFTVKFPAPVGIDEHKVNSIMRPTLPNINYWYIRLP
jgi:spermidine synthase